MNCAKCPAEIEFVLLKRKDGGTTRTPLDARPSERGNIVREGGGLARVLAGESLANAKAAGVALYLNHFVTCPSAKSFRRKP